MEKDIKQRVEEFLANFPTEKMSPASEDFLRAQPLDWVVARNRELTAAILNGDIEAMYTLEEDVAHVIGYEDTLLWINITISLIFPERNNEEYQELE